MVHDQTDRGEVAAVSRPDRKPEKVGRASLLLPFMQAAGGTPVHRAAEYKKSLRSTWL
jgi:hypothetical protein